MDLGGGVCSVHSLNCFAGHNFHHLQSCSMLRHASPKAFQNLCMQAGVSSTCPRKHRVMLLAAAIELCWSCCGPPRHLAKQLEAHD